MEDNNCQSTGNPKKRYAIKQIKSGKAAGPSSISAEHLKYLNNEGLEWAKELLNRIINEEKITIE